MAAEPPHIVLTIETKEPIELGAFVSAFTSLANQYEKFIRAEHPELSEEAQIFVREVRPGSIVADLIPLGIAVLPAVVEYLDRILIVEEFIQSYGKKLAAYFAGEKDPTATKSDLKDFMGAVVAIANDPRGSGSLEAITYEDGKRDVRAAIKFRSSDARRAIQSIETQQELLESPGDADHKRVLMAFRQANVKSPAVGRRTGERVVIEEISDKELALIYAAELAERHIKYEMTVADENVFKKGFVVDVNVQTRASKPVAYRVTHLHQVIDLPDDSDDSPSFPDLID
jgi:hypothetical protein